MDGGEDVGEDIFETAASSRDGCDNKEGAGGQSRVSSNSCGLRGDTGVGGPEDCL